MTTLPNSSTQSEGDFAIPNEQSTKNAAIQKAKEFRAYAGEKATAIKEEAGVKLKQGTAKAKELHGTAEDYVRENPTKSILGAVGLGVVIGLIMRR